MEPEEYIDFSDLEITVTFTVDDEFLNTDKFKAAVPEFTQAVLLEAKNFWESEAGRRLKTSRQEYINAISMRTYKKSGNLTLEGGFLPWAVEMGTDSFDMKPGFLKNGISRVIPLNISRKPAFSRPDMYRTAKAGTHQADKWIHPGFKGMFIYEDVINELKNNIIPRHLKILSEKL